MVHPRVFEELKKIDEMIGERADASLFDIRICSMYVTGLPSQDGRIAPRLTACVTFLCRTFQSYGFKLYFFHGISVPLSIQAMKFLMQRSRNSQHSFQVKVYNIPESTEEETLKAYSRLFWR